MKKILQTRFGAPHGNCEAAAYASVLELSLDEVPDPKWPEDVPWEEAQPDTLTDRGKAVQDMFYETWKAWLAERNLAAVNFPSGEWFPDAYTVASVINPRGLPHAVVMHGDKIVWDPNPEQDSYDCKPTNITLFIAIDPARVIPR